MRWAFATVLMLTVASGVHGEELQVPYGGSTQQMDGNGGMTWTCEPQSASGSISCSFVQVSVRKPDIPDREAEASKLLASFSRDECAQLDDALAQAVAKAREVGAEDWIRKNAERTVSVYRRLCSAFDLNAALGVVDFQQDLDRKTCNISTWPFSLTFNRSEAGDKWEAIDGPRGSCGVVKFVSLVPDYPVGSTLPLWSFRQRSVVTNPEATGIDGRSCSEWSEERIEFVWKKQVIRPMCEFVRHGAF